MKYCGTLLVVSDIVKSKEFYEKILEQKVVMDLGVHVAFESGISLQENYAELVGKDLAIQKEGNNFQLYFEVEDIESWYAKIKNVSGVEFIHDIKEYPWGQRVMRFYEFDRNIVEVSESMECVVKRFLKEGLSVEETAKRTMFPVEFVESCL